MAQVPARAYEKRTKALTLVVEGNYRGWNSERIKQEVLRVEEDEGYFGCFGRFQLPFSWIWATPEKVPSDSDGADVAAKRSSLEFKCRWPGCTKSYETEGGLHWHASHHEQASNETVDSSTHRCEECGKSFYEYKKLLGHLERHQAVNAHPDLNGIPPAEAFASIMKKNYPGGIASITDSEPSETAHRTTHLSAEPSPLQRTESCASARTLVQPTLSNRFPELTAPGFTNQLVDADAHLDEDVDKIIVIEHFHATTKGVRASNVLTGTRLGTMRLLGTVSFGALDEREHIASQVGELVGPTTYAKLKSIHENGSVFPFPIFNGSPISETVSSEASRRLLEAGEDIKPLILDSSL
ncbi:hypothetical protein AG0111_0g12087 [Alternaria gaisen]|uniref:Uncharacterized protein n=1 Tax=Alternaria gaisen TaxID=167740 RepID=A0ACB6F5H5_9PLEO|nr:hypothetical protein AG0111_0g12087 [Alternaria gaisen]